MRKPGLSFLTLAIVVGSAIPALAVETRRETSRSASAYWVFERKLSRDTFRRMTWAVGVYESSNDGTFSDVYQTFQRCRVRPRGGKRCRTVRYRTGYSDLADGTFTLEETDLTAARLAAGYELETYDRRGEEIGRVTHARIVAAWTGTGFVNVDEFEGRSTRRCRKTHFEGESHYRKALATARINGRNIGSTRASSLGTSEEVVETERTCGREPS